MYLGVLMCRPSRCRFSQVYGCSGPCPSSLHVLRPKKWTSNSPGLCCINRDILGLNIWNHPHCRIADRGLKQSHFHTWRDRYARSRLSPQMHDPVKFLWNRVRFWFVVQNVPRTWRILKACQFRNGRNWMQYFAARWCRSCVHKHKKQQGCPVLHEIETWQSASLETKLIRSGRCAPASWTSLLTWSD